MEVFVIALLVESVLFYRQICLFRGFVTIGTGHGLVGQGRRINRLPYVFCTWGLKLIQVISRFGIYLLIFVLICSAG